MPLEALPIHAYKQRLIDELAPGKVMILVGETGSGKTTQLPQFALAAGLGANGRIGCTQPRRIAAKAVARRVAAEMHVALGEEVGYAVRFDDYTSARTVIKYLTDGMLLRETLTSPNLDAYSVIILDEAHERTVATDILFGLLKAIHRRRGDLCLVITSATLEAEKFSQFFFDCPVLRIPGRAFPVHVRYAPKPEPDYVEAAIATAAQIHAAYPPGDILVFLTGQEEIDAACEALPQRAARVGALPPLVLPVYANLPAERQGLIFMPAPPGVRKIVVATNIAEASITIDGILYVVDPGFCKVKIFNPKLGLDSLQVAPVSQAAANQRAGRAGRTAPGTCYRLYTEKAFAEEFLPAAVPEIQRSDLCATVLLLKALGINDLLGFEFMDPPSPRYLIASLEILYALGALDEHGILTKLGGLMADFPLSPPLAKVLLAAADLACLAEAVTVIAMLSAQGVFYRPREQAARADSRHSRFHSPEGDHVSLLRIYEAWGAHGESAVWAQENFLQQKALLRAKEVRLQLCRLCVQARLPLISCGEETRRLRKAFAAGFFANAVKRHKRDAYATLSNDQTVFMHPASALFRRCPPFALYSELLMTSKEYMRDVSVIDPRWLVDVASRLYRFADPFTAKSRMNRSIAPLNARDPHTHAGKLNKRLRNLDKIMM